MGRRHQYRQRTPSPPVAAPALLLLLTSRAFVLLLLFFRCGAAAAAARAPLPVHHENGVNKDAAAAGLQLVLPDDGEGAAGNGDAELSTSEKMMGADQEVDDDGEAASCEEGNDDDDDECVQRRLLRDAHLDYIYTQHKGNKP